MKWLHLSDLHYYPEGDGRSTHQLREKLIHYLNDEGITADHLFLTGDYRHAKHQKDGSPSVIESAANYILRIASTAKIPKSNIHIIPGNHDLTRTNDTDRLTQIKNLYESNNGRILQEDLDFLLNRFVFFKGMCNMLESQGASQIWPNTLQPLHTYHCYEDFSVLYLNTCLTCNSDADRGNLIIGNYYLYAALEEIQTINPGKPIIALAHHGLDNFRNDEKISVEQIFADYPVKLYLCGDAHQPWQRRSNDFLELTTGCLIHENNARTLFSAGELRGDEFSIEAHEWDVATGSWGAYSQFNNQFKKRELTPSKSKPVFTASIPAHSGNKPDIKKPCGSTDVGEPQAKTRNLFLIGTENNDEETIFDRLIGDVFHALGFSEPYHIAEESDGAIDLAFRHRTEKRFALVKHLHQKEQVGKNILNSFAGAFDVEESAYAQDGTSVVGYVVSASGFTPVAVEQEKKRGISRQTEQGKDGLILLGPSDIVRELIQGNVLCSLSTVEEAGKRRSKSLFFCEDVDLLACEYGWLWVLYYASTPGGGATHFAIVHADGKQLSDKITELLLKQIHGEKYPFSDLTYIKNEPTPMANAQAAQSAYFEYLQNELGEIQFEGMPTDQEAGAVKVNLESIFVPLEFHREKNGTVDEIDDFDDDFSEGSQRTCIGDILTDNPRVAILAKPGGGKSTLMRRIALAYAYPERKAQVDDNLPNEAWLPIYIRCRDLGDDVTKSILEIMEKIMYRAEMKHHKNAFGTLIEDALQNGRLLLLVDGLDEISQEKSRICFVNQMRTFVATYPTMHLIVTSREAGFRAVAGTLSGYCEHYTIANLNEKQIRQLSLKWHQALLGESAQAEDESEKVCNIILNDARIIALAENPLLLTTLLFVKRWVGYLPTKKCRLYEEMIKLLLVTWNAAGHDKLDMDETEPQLAFVAYTMTTCGTQKITRDELIQCIVKARKAMPELLGYTQISPTKFIDQVEERSSLLIQMGLEENHNGRLVPSYEFSHLSFQEYLTAKAIAEFWLPDTDNNDPFEELKPHMEETQWREVIPLSAVLLGRSAKPLIEHLITISNEIEPNKYLNIEAENAATETQYTQAPLHLANCIASEVPMNQQQLDEALALVVKNRDMIERKVDNMELNFDSEVNLDIFTTILKSKYGSSYRRIVRRGLFENVEPDYIYEFSDAWIKTCCAENGCVLNRENILSLLMANDRQSQITGSLMMMQTIFNNWKKDKENGKELMIDTKAASILLKFLRSDDFLLVFSAAWCIAWAGYDAADSLLHEAASDILNQLIKLWLGETDCYPKLKRTISWGIYSVCIPGLKIQVTDRLKEAIDKHFYSPQNDFDRCAAVHLAVLTGYWTDEKTKEILWQGQYPSRMPHNYSRFLQECGFKKSSRPSVHIGAKVKQNDPS